MSELTSDELQKIADDAPIIVSGYAFTPDAEGFIRVLNLYKPEEACVLDAEGNMIATTVDDVTLLKIQDIYRRNKQFMEDD